MIMTRNELKEIAVLACLSAGKYLNDNKQAKKEIVEEESFGE